MTLGKDEKRVKQVLTIPIDDNGEEDLYSHLSDIIHFIGKKQDSISSNIPIVWSWMQFL